MREFKKHIIKALSLLGVLLVVGIKQAKAANIVTDFIGGVLNFVVGEAVEPLATALSAVVTFVINTIGTLFFNVAAFFVEYTIHMNLQLPNSSVIPTGLGATIPLANILLVLALIVSAFATMVRAEWLVEIRQAIPKILASILILNFTFLLFAQMVIPTVDEITERIFEATNYNEDTFRSILKPDIDIGAILEIQFAIENAGEGEKRDILIKYLDYRDDFIKTTWAALTEGQEALPPLGTITNAQKADVLNAMIRSTDFWARDPQQSDIGNTLGSIGGSIFKFALGATAFALAPATGGGSLALLGTVALGGVGGILYISATNDAINAVQSVVSGVIDSWSPDWKAHDLDNAIKGASLAAPGYGELAEHKPGEYGAMIDKIHQGMAAAANEHFKCDISAQDPGTDNCSDFVEGAVLLTQEPSGTQRAVIKLAEAAFNGAWAFIGILVLFALGIMLFMRYVVLALLVILFPIVLILWPFPKLAGIGGGDGKGNLWKSWWSQFFRWLFFAPIMMFFLWLSIRISSGLEEATSLNVPDIGSGHTGLVGAAIGELAVTAGFLVAGLYAANKMSITSSKMFYEKGLKGARNAVGKWVQKGAIKSGKVLGAYAARQGLRGVTAPLRHPSVQGEPGEDGILTKGQQLASGRGRIGRTLLAPVTVGARGLARVSDRAGASIIDQKTKRWVDGKGKLKQAPWRSLREYSTLTTDADKIAFIKAHSDGGYLWEATPDVTPQILSDIKKFKEDGTFAKFNQKKLELDLAGEGIHPAVVTALKSEVALAEEEGRAPSIFPVYETFRDKYAGATDADLRKLHHLMFNPEQESHGMNKEEKEIMSTAISHFFTEERTDMLPGTFRKSDEAGQAKVYQEFVEARDNDTYGLLRRIFGTELETIQALPYAQRREAQVDYINEHWDQIQGAWAQGAAMKAKDWGATSEQMSKESTRALEEIQKMGKEGVMKLVTQISNAKWGGWGTYTPMGTPGGDGT